MRVISGIYKNKKLLLPTDKLTRPLKEMVRESIFNIIEHSNLIKNKIVNSIILDLYSGSGSFGVECLSRGASKVHFCENYTPAYKILRKNLINLGVDHIDLTINPNVEKKILLETFKKKGSTAISMHLGIFNIPLIFAKKFKIPLIIWGENSAFEYGYKKKTNIS